jgi:hypothetical protein
MPGSEEQDVLLGGEKEHHVAVKKGFFNFLAGVVVSFLVGLALSVVIELIAVLFFKSSLVTGFIAAFALNLVGISASIIAATTVREIPFRRTIVGFLTVGSIAGFTGAVIGGPSLVLYWQFDEIRQTPVKLHVPVAVFAPEILKFPPEAYVDTARVGRSVVKAVHEELCAAPIVNNHKEKEVIFWAVGDACCAKKVTCEGWDQRWNYGFPLTRGHFWGLWYQRSSSHLYNKAVENASLAYGIKVPAHSVYVQWTEHPSNSQSDRYAKAWRYLVLIPLGSPLALALCILCCNMIPGIGQH